MRILLSRISLGFDRRTYQVSNDFAFSLAKAMLLSLTFGWKVISFDSFRFVLSRSSITRREYDFEEFGEGALYLSAAWRWGWNVQPSISLMLLTASNSSRSAILVRCLSTLRDHNGGRSSDLDLQSTGRVLMIEGCMSRKHSRWHTVFLNLSSNMPPSSLVLPCHLGCLRLTCHDSFSGGGVLTANEGSASSSPRNSFIVM
mmetsp:Transcript_54926/g.96321  ORF Transcript_54926/g.96321 Transcript_54926/m.96321 type:complete len:201 (-) Transcript_54926:712-1314(-)